METLTIPAYYQYDRPAGTRVRLIVLHDPGVAGAMPSSIARFNSIPEWQRNPRGVGGYHEVGNGAQLVLCASDRRFVYGAAGANVDGWHYCSTSIDAASIDIAANRVARACRAFGIPVRALDVAGYRSGAAGIITHATVEQAIGAQSPHVDPVNWPMAAFLQHVQAAMAPEVKVPVEYDPGYKLPPIVSSCAHPRGAILLGADGGIFCFPVAGGPPFRGSPSGQPLSTGERWADVRLWQQGDFLVNGKPGVYTVLTSAGDKYCY